MDRSSFPAHCPSLSLRCAIVALTRSPAHLSVDWLLLYWTKSRPFSACSNAIRRACPLGLGRIDSDWLTLASLSGVVPAPVFWPDIKTCTLFFSAPSRLWTEVSVWVCVREKCCFIRDFITPVAEEINIMFQTENKSGSVWVCVWVSFLFLSTQMFKRL